jgi:hypothetical protein
MKPKNAPEKFYFVEVNAEPCTKSELRMHLAEFGRAFIARNHLDRWTHVTQERPAKAKDELGKFILAIDEKFQETLYGSDGFPNALAKRFSGEPGVYFDGIEEPCKVTAVEASTLAVERTADALFSIVPGRLAIFFFHEGDVILFQKS